VMETQCMCVCDMTRLHVGVGVGDAGSRGTTYVCA